jgi:DNA repair protein SbcD/Mre11
LRLLHLADLHLGYRQFQRQTPAGINQREADVAGAFVRVVDAAITMRPNVIVIAGDIFHNVRPTNPAIIHAFNQFSRLVQSLPDTPVVMIAGNHDTPRSSETGCILNLFKKVGAYVVAEKPERLAFPQLELSVLAVPHTPGDLPELDPDPSARYNVLVLHGAVEGVLPLGAMGEAWAAQQIPTKTLGAHRWSYVALGHYHVFHPITPNAFYAGSLDYTSSNIWGEWQEEQDARIGGKGMIEFDLDVQKHTFHRIQGLRPLVELPWISAKGLTSGEVDAAIRANVEHCAGGIENKIVRQVVRDIPRHIVRELDHKALRDYKRRALHYHLDPRRPEILRERFAGTAGRRPSLADTVRDKLRARLVPADIDREALVELGLHYLREAELVEATTAVVAEGA